MGLQQEVLEALMFHHMQGTGHLLEWATTEAIKDLEAECPALGHKIDQEWKQYLADLMLVQEDLKTEETGFTTTIIRLQTVKTTTDHQV